VQTRALQISDDVERLLIVSDLHGFVEPLKELDRLFALYEGKSQVVAAGDYVVNGGRPAEVVDWVRRHAGEFAVTGNHDQEALKGAEGDFAPYTDPGAFLCFSEEQKDYLTGLPEVLELSWKGRKIRINHGRRASGEWVSWKATTAEVFDAFADPSVDLTVVAHTHCPFVRRESRGHVANCGSTSCLILGHEAADGSVQSKTDVSFKPIARIYSTFLSATASSTGLEVRVERFEYDRLPEAELLQDLGHPRAQQIRKWLDTGVFWS
jgi:protein phosphatase